MYTILSTIIKPGLSFKLLFARFLPMCQAVASKLSSQCLKIFFQDNLFPISTVVFLSDFPISSAYSSSKPQSQYFVLLDFFFIPLDFLRMSLEEAVEENHCIILIISYSNRWVIVQWFKATKIRLIMFFAAKDGDTLYSQ